MAATTLTYTIGMQAQPKAPHTGVTSLAWNYNSGALKLGTLSDTVLLGRIPNGALLLTSECFFGISTAGATHYALMAYVTDALGTLSAYATLIGSMTASLTAANFRTGVPLKISLSDDRAIQYVTLALNVTTGASATVSTSFQGHVLYTMDGSNV